MRCSGSRARISSRSSNCDRATLDGSRATPRYVGMQRLLLLVAACGLAATTAAAQGVAPGGSIYNSTSIGSGLGNVIGGTAPRHPHGTTAPPPPPTNSPGPPPPPRAGEHTAPR